MQNPVSDVVLLLAVIYIVVNTVCIKQDVAALLKTMNKLLKVIEKESNQ